MTAAATSRPSPRTAWSPRSPTQALPMPSTTPSGFPAVRSPAPSGQPVQRISKALSPHAARSQRSTSPNYFEYVTDPNTNPPNSNAGMHARKNWSPLPTTEQRKSSTSSQNLPLESNPRLENFRRQSETQTFNLSHGSLSTFSSRDSSSPTNQPTIIEHVPDKSTRRRAALSSKSPHSTPDDSNAPPSLEAMDIESHGDRPSPVKSPEGSAIFDGARRDSPANMSSSDLSKLPRTQISHIDERHPRNSLPHNRVDVPAHVVQRSETLPSSISTDGPTMVSPKDFVEIMKGHLPQDFLLLDLRVNPQYSKSRIQGALNLCIPTTLLKRASFNIQRLAETFTKEKEKAKFDGWRQTKFIVVYDVNSSQLKDATSSVNTLKKFTNEKYAGATLIIRGGFNTFSRLFPEQVDERSANDLENSSAQKLSLDPPPAAAPVAGGCMMPATQNAANPFFGSIRQNMDLIGGVGQMPVQRPQNLQDSTLAALPKWLKEVSIENVDGKAVADRFYGIEKAEQRRMQKALSCNVVYGTPNPLSPEAVQIAGIEKGTKNRYKDMLPYDHTRVKLQDVPSGGCDYVNASHVKAEHSNKHYIASQAPVPDSIPDFWRVAWEQDARVIVMLTAESEGGQTKCHPYWLPGDYGPFKLKALSERHQALDKTKPDRSLTSPQMSDSQQRPSISRRHTGSYTSYQSTQNGSSYNATPPLDPTIPHVIVRKLTLQHANQPFEPIREITQIQYSSWPDFGAPAHPTQLLGIVENCNTVIRSYQPSNVRQGPNEPANNGERPVVVHCSAGCGRTGTFCTVDSVIDMLKQQRQSRQQRRGDNAMDVDISEQDKWTLSDDEDLVAKTVANFRLQRLSMVQTLRQFVLCYETVLEWVAEEIPSARSKDASNDGAAARQEKRIWSGSG
ncbi:phosphotyrosine-specific ptp2-like protein [Lecanora helva]